MRDFRSKRIDERDVPESRHALFFRGLHPEQNEVEIREFFADKIGPCRVVFYKQSRDSVCSAVRFEKREDAKKCLKSFENKKVMNSNVEISWFRDVRMYAEKLKAREGFNNHSRRTSYHSRSSQRPHHRSIERGVSISSDENSPKRRRRKHSEDSSNASKRSISAKRSGSRSKRSHSKRHSRSRSSYSSSTSSSASNRHRRRGPHTPPQTPPLDQTEEMSISATLPEFIRAEVVGDEKNVGLICLNRPVDSNALTTAMVDEIADQLAKFESDNSIGSIVLTGTDNAFAVGINIKEIAPENLSNCYENGFLENWNQVARINKPIIAAVNGLASGTGCELAMGCDIIYASENAEFAQPEILNGTIQGAGGTQRLARVVGKSLAMEMCLTGTKIKADEALNRGLISKVFPSENLLSETIKIAETIAKNSPTLNIMAKKSVNYAYESSLQTGIAFERHMFISSIFSSTDKKQPSPPGPANDLIPQ